MKQKVSSVCDTRNYFQMQTVKGILKINLNN